MATLKSTSRVPPPYVYPNCWGLGELIVLCECVHRQIGAHPESQPVEQYVVDWDVVTSKIHEVQPHRVSETNVTCYVQYFTLSTSVLRSGNLVYVDALSAVLKCLSVLRESRVRELLSLILLCEEKAKIYQADYDFHLGKSLDPSMMQAPVALPLTHADAPIYFASAGAVGGIPSPITGNGNAPSVQFHVVPTDRIKALTYSFINNMYVSRPVEDTQRLQVGTAVQLCIPTCVAPVDVFMEPRVFNQSVLKCIVEDIYTSLRAGPFLYPVKPHEAPRYLEIIAKPMDLGTVRSMVHSGQVPHAFALFELISLVYTNAYTYNAKNAEIWLMARDLDFHTSAIFQCSFPHYADLFVPSVIDAKKGVRKLRKTQVEPNTIMPISKHKELLTTLQQLNIPVGIVQAPTPVMSGAISAPLAHVDNTVSISAPTNAAVTKQELPLVKEEVSSLDDVALLPSTATKKKKRSPSPPIVPPMPSLVIPDMNANSSSSNLKTPNRRSKTPRPDDGESDMSTTTPASKRQRAGK